MPLEPEQMLAHYRLLEKIGEGGMGVVWKAVDTTLDREVAIKVLPEALAADPDRLERFRREAKLLASLNHARIASLYALHETEDVRFLSMELIHGQDLAQLLQRGPLGVEQALRLALQMTEGLEAAHESGIIHRDLKPANIKLTASGDVKILDFGLAKALHDPMAGSEADMTQSPTMTASATQAGIVLGTAAYMSPEQARGHQADRRTDIWAFGCVLYEMLTGRGVFRAPTASDCIAGILGGEPDWHALPAGTPHSIRRLLRRCLEKDARHRLHDIADVRIEIEETLAGDKMGMDSGVPEARPEGTKASRIGWVAAGLVLGILATAFVASRGTSPWTAGDRSPGRYSVSLPGSPVIPKTGTSSLAISPDGTHLVYVGLEPGGAATRASEGVEQGPLRTQLFVRRVDDYQVRALEGTLGAHSPFFSPDGEWVGFIADDGNSMKKTRLRGGVPVSILEGFVRGPEWGDDGRIFFSGDHEGIGAVPENGGVPETLTTPDRDRGEKTRRFPHALPGGRGLLFTLGSISISSYDEASVALLDLETGAHRVLLEGGTDPAYVPTGHILYGRGGTLEAVPFDLDSMQITGSPFTVAHDVVISDGWGEAQYTVSDSGTLAYVPGGPDLYQYSIYWLDRDGNVEALPLPPRTYSTAVFSPDGKRLVINTLGANATIWVYEIERRTMTRLTTEWDNHSPIWTRGGSHVTFTSNRTGVQGLWRIAADGSGGPERLHVFNDVMFAGSWTGGDRSLIFSSPSPGTGSDIWILPVGEDGGQAEPLFQSAFQEGDPALSPDGRWLAYSSDETGRKELYVQRFPGRGRKSQVSAGGGETPLWAPDGRELYYWKGSRLMAVPVATEPEFAPGMERELPHPDFDVLLNWDIAPDGERFVVVGRTAGGGASRLPSLAVDSGNRLRRVEASVREIRVVTDWFTELRRGPS